MGKLNVAPQLHGVYTVLLHVGAGFQFGFSCCFCLEENYCYIKINVKTLVDKLLSVVDVQIECIVKICAKRKAALIRIISNNFTRILHQARWCNT